MPRSKYYNLLKTEERQAHVDYIAQRLGIGDSSTPNTWGKVINFCLRTVRYSDQADNGLDRSPAVSDSWDRDR